MIKLKGQEKLYSQLSEWVKDNIGWIKSAEEAKEYALEIHAAQIFDNPEWCDYVAFNTLYRPEILKKE